MWGAHLSWSHIGRVAAVPQPLQVPAPGWGPHRKPLPHSHIQWWGLRDAPICTPKLPLGQPPAPRGGGRPFLLPSSCLVPSPTRRLVPRFEFIAGNTVASFRAAKLQTHLLPRGLAWLPACGPEGRAAGCGGNMRLAHGGAAPKGRSGEGFGEACRLAAEPGWGRGPGVAGCWLLDQAPNGSESWLAPKAMGRPSSPQALSTDGPSLPKQPWGGAGPAGGAVLS